jgi:hypothetical protein
MTAATLCELPAVSRRVLQLQVLTIAWMTVEAVVSLGSAWSSHSPALFAFGGDSFIELLSATVVLWCFSVHGRRGTGSSDCGSLAFHVGGTPGAHLRFELSWISRSAAESSRGRNLVGRRSCNALARQPETAVDCH